MMYFSAENGGAVCLEGDNDICFTDAEILEMLKGNLFLASDTAMNLIARGFGKYLGADVRPWKGKTPTSEFLSVNGNKCNVQQQLKELVPTSPDTRVDSMVAHSVDKVHYEDLFPGTTIYENELGGKVFMFCGTPKANFHLVDAFSFLTYSRKLQMIRMLDETGELTVYYPGDEDVYFRTADMEDGGTFCALFNLSCDPIEETKLICKKPISKIERLMPDGTTEEVAFTHDGNGEYTLSVTCEHLYPVILLMH